MRPLERPASSYPRAGNPGRRVSSAGAVLAAAGALALLALPARSDPVGRFEMPAGSTCLGQIERPGEFDEYVVDVARGAKVSVRLGTESPSGCRPISGILDADYVPVPVFARSFTSIGTAFPATDSGPLRVIVTGQNGSMGGYRIANTIRPQRRFTLKSKAQKTPDRPPPAEALVFGAYPGFTFTVSAKASGSDGVATVASVVGPDGALLTPSSSAKRRVRLPGGKRATRDVDVYTVTKFGDHWVRLDVPDDAKSWSATVSLRGSFPRGAPHDLRPDAVRPAPLTIVNSAAVPLVQVNDELGGPNAFGVVAEAGRPIAVFADSRTGGCVRATTETAEFPQTYDLRCNNGYLAQITGALLDPDGELRSFEMPVLRDPVAAGSGAIEDIVYDELGKAVSWTEVRHFAASGRTHTLEFSDVQRYGNLDHLPIFPRAERFEGLLGVDQPIEAGTTFTEVFDAPAGDFGATRVQPGDVLRFVRDPVDLSGNEGAIVARNVRDIPIVAVTQTTLTLAEPLVEEAPPPGTRFQYFIARRTSFVRSYSVTHTGPDGRRTTMHNAGGRAR